MKRLKKLPKKFNKSGFEHHLIERTKTKAIYKRINIETRDYHYEVIVIRTGPPHHLGKDKDEYKLVEIYPSQAHWGQYGFSYSNDNRENWLALQTKYDSLK